MTATFDVIVAGVGAMGAAACSALAQRGARVLGIERFDVPHPFGSSGGQTRLIRKAYYEHPDYVPLLERAYAAWHELEARTRTALLFQTGLVCAGPPDGVLVTGMRRAAQAHRLELATLAREELTARVPALRVPSGFDVLFEAQGGFLLCERAVAAFAHDALEHGAVLRARERIVRWDVTGDGVHVFTDKDHYRAARLVITAGPWSARFLAERGLRLRVTRQCVGWVRPQRPALFAYGAFPCFLIDDDTPGASGCWYGFPSLPSAVFAGPSGLKVGYHAPGPVVDPDALDRALRAAEEARIHDGLTRFLPEADGPLLAAQVCMYTNSDDGHFVVDRHPSYPPVVFACGFSGHGFKFAPVIGEALADLALDGGSSLPIGFLSLARFGGGPR
ncbi:MAG: N-methyl-L-tryptophan oxidase [Planctomycetes bacterium]|nr:N-methyl-L-tryptophan oxidase [Planctomycetota bacterium]